MKKRILFIILIIFLIVILYTVYYIKTRDEKTFLSRKDEIAKYEKSDNTSSEEANNEIEEKEIQEELEKFEEQEKEIEQEVKKIEEEVKNENIISNIKNNDNLNISNKQDNSTSNNTNTQESVANTEEKKNTQQEVTIPKEEPVIEKSIYDYEFDIEKIKNELIKIGQNMGLIHITTDEGVMKTPNNSSWGAPITASQNFQGKKLERALKDYVTSTPTIVKSYGGDLEYFTIYVEDNGNGSYTFYFLY